MPRDADVIETVEIEFEKKILTALTTRAETNRRSLSAHLNHILETEFFSTSNRLCTELKAQELVRKTIVEECRVGVFGKTVGAINERIAKLEEADDE